MLSLWRHEMYIGFPSVVFAAISTICKQTNGEALEGIMNDGDTFFNFRTLVGPAGSPKIKC